MRIYQQTFPNFLWISVLKQMQLDCLHVLNRSFMRFSRNDAENVNGEKKSWKNPIVWKIPEVTVGSRRNTRVKC